MQPEPALQEALERLARERSVAAANERLLVRLGFDLHDGPLQHVYVLAQDVRLLREQTTLLLEDPHRSQVLGRFADLESELAALHRDLRDLAHSLEPRALLKQPLPHTIRRELAALERRTGIKTSLSFDGSFDTLSASQRIALLRVLQEALSNIRQHSGARSARVTVTAGADGVRLEIRDDGRGFELDGSRPPAREAQFGLVGMRERVRLLGGQLVVTSRTGGPTVVLATLPPWLPAEPAASPAAA